MIARSTATSSDMLPTYYSLSVFLRLRLLKTMEKLRGWDQDAGPLENFYLKIVDREGRCQRVFHVLYWTRLSRRRIIWLLHQPLTHPQTSVSSSSDTEEDWEREKACWQKKMGRGGGEGAKSNDGEKASYSITHSKYSLVGPKVVSTRCPY